MVRALSHNFAPCDELFYAVIYGYFTLLGRYYFTGTVGTVVRRTRLGGYNIGTGSTVPVLSLHCHLLSFPCCRSHIVDMILGVVLTSLSPVLAFNVGAPTVLRRPVVSVASADLARQSVRSLSATTSCRMQASSAEPELAAAEAHIEFIVGVPEPCVPDVALTRSRDGSTGVATFTFDNPSFLAASSAELGETTGLSSRSLFEPAPLSTVGLCDRLW